MKFDLGQTVATPGVLRAMTATGETPIVFLHRHATGDWGDVTAHDQQANDRALTHGSRIFSAYRLKDDTKFWIITEAVDDEGGRRSSRLLLPDEY